jgi:hypothetical protein
MIRIRCAAAIAGLALVAGCVPAAQSTASPAGPPPALGIDWGRVASVERPVNYDATLPPGDQRAHPILRIPGQAYLADVTPLKGGGYAAVGYIPPVWTAAAWTSPDAASWSLHPIDADPFSFAVSVATGADGTLAAVGRSGSQPIAWTSSDGATWQQNAVPTLGHDGIAERMTTIVAGASGFVAGGSLGPELFDRHARFWTSADGASWQPVPDDPVAFANAEVRSITRLHDGFVAVGVVGTAQQATAAVAWTSPDGSHWTRVDDASFAGAVAVSVAAAPSGGLVAVGSDVARREAIAWTSADGRHWTRAPAQASLRYPGGYMWMTDVTPVGDHVLAVGIFQGLQRGTATSWISSDGATWQQARTAPSQEGAEWYATTAGGPGAIVVGAFGAPDSYVPEVWLTPSR